MGRSGNYRADNSTPSTVWRYLISECREWHRQQGIG